MKNMHTSSSFATAFDRLKAILLLLTFNGIAFGIPLIIVSNSYLLYVNTKNFFLLSMKNSFGKCLFKFKAFIY